MKKNDQFITTVEKAKLLYSDFVQAVSREEKEVFLEILETYIDDLNDSRVSLVYFKVCDSSESEKEMYIEILGDLLERMSENL